MQIEATTIPDVKIITPIRLGDDRGFFSEVYKKWEWDDGLLIYNFVQDNHSFSRFKGTLRGLHFQTEPFAQDKLIRVVRGSIFDVAVDLRKSSATFGKHVAVELSAKNWRQLLVPIGFAHGFVTLEPDTEVVYKVTSRYSASNDRGLAWNDPDLNIVWPGMESGFVLSDKDKQLPTFRKLTDLFP